MVKAMWITILTYFGLIAIPYSYGSIEPEINWVDVDAADWYGAMSQDDRDWLEFEIDAYMEYEDEFTAIFNAIEFKVAKNGRSMVKGIHDKSFKFAKKG